MPRYAVIKFQRAGLGLGLHNPNQQAAKMIEWVLQLIIALGSLFAVAFFFSLLGFKRFPGGGWHSDSPIGCAAILAAVIALGVVGTALWKDFWGSNAGLAFMSLIALAVFAFAFWNSKPSDPKR